MIIDTNTFGQTIGQISGKLMEKDLEAYKNGELREDFFKLAEESLLMRTLLLEKIKTHQILGPMLDAKLKY